MLRVHEMEPVPGGLGPDVDDAQSHGAVVHQVEQFGGVDLDFATAEPALQLRSPPGKNLVGTRITQSRQNQGADDQDAGEDDVHRELHCSPPGPRRKARSSCSAPQNMNTARAATRKVTVVRGSPVQSARVTRPMSPDSW